MWGDFFLRILSLANQCVHHQIAKCLERFSATLCHSEHFLVVNPQLYFYFAEKTAKSPFCLYAFLIKSRLLEEITEHVQLAIKKVVFVEKDRRSLPNC